MKKRYMYILYTVCVYVWIEIVDIYRNTLYSTALSALDLLETGLIFECCSSPRTT